MDAWGVWYFGEEEAKGGGRILFLVLGFFGFFFIFCFCFVF